MKLDRPIFIVGSARSGTTLLRTCLERSSSLWRLGRGSKTIWDAHFHPLRDGRRNHVLGADDASPELGERLRAAYAHQCYLPVGPTDAAYEKAWLHRLAAQGVDPYYYEVPIAQLQQWYGGQPPEGPPFLVETEEIPPFTILPPSVTPTEQQKVKGFRLLDKEPAHAFRLPLLRALFPDARFLFVVRDGRPTVSSLIEAWRHPRWFFSYKMPIPLQISGYSDRFPWGDRWWNLQLPPNWSELADKPLEEVCAHYWLSVNRSILEHADSWLEAGIAMMVRYEELVDNPLETLERVAGFVDLPASDIMPTGRLPVVSTSTAPEPDKWRKNQVMVERILPLISELQERFGYSAGRLS